MSSKDKKSTRLSQANASSLVSTEVDFIIPSNAQLAKSELNNMVNSQKRHYWIDKKVFLMKTHNEDMKRYIEDIYFLITVKN